MEYERYGTGKSMLIAFHGFGRSHRDFASMSEEIADSHTVIACNLFHHGNSTIPAFMVDQSPLTKAELVDFFKAFLHHLEITRTSICGYSLGGNIALAVFEGIPERVDSLILFAPDGIRKSRWYHFVSRNRLGRSIYRRVINNPKTFFRLMEFAVSLRIISKKMQKFVLDHMTNREQRQLVYNIWNTFRNIDVDINCVCSLVQEHQTNTHLVFGEYDRVIKPIIGERIIGKLGPSADLHIVPHGHHLLDRLIYDEIDLKRILRAK